MGNAEQALTQQPSEQSGCTRHHRSLNKGFLHSLKHHQSPTLGPTPEEAPHGFRRKGRRCGVRTAATSPPPWYLLQFHRWRKVSGGSFPWAPGRLTGLARWVFRGSSGPGRHCPTRPGARGPWPPTVSTGWTRVPRAGRPAGRATTSSAWSLLHPREARANLIQARNLLHLLTY